jgi:putative oxidoreductase
MQAILGRYTSYGFALFRIVAGLMFTMHGTQKLFGIPGGKPGVPIGSMLGVAGITELICGLLILLGLFGSIAALIASGEMAVAYFLAHFPRAFWPIVNQGELAVLYCFAFLYIAAHGSGIWSVDNLLARPAFRREHRADFRRAA